MKNKKSTKELIRDIVILASKVDFNERNVSIYFNKKGELIVRVNVGRAQ